ncbi:MAG: class I SAM-dependent methyltransferase [Thalassovita sp.]
MFTFEPDTFGTLNASDYDATQNPGTTDQTVAFLSQLAAGGRMLELAIGTGRIALPLSLAGHDVAGIEGSPVMVALLRQKPGGEALHVEIGDMADVDIAGTFDHIFLVFNTLFNLNTQEDQIRLFQNVAQKLTPGGSFLVETFVPDFKDFSNHQRVSSKNMTENSVWLEAAHHDPVAQRIAFQRLRITETGMKLVPFPMRYAWPSELDLMARLAGLKLEDRFGDWESGPFHADSKMHVSVYRKPA